MSQTLEITHHTLYSYDIPIVLNPHIFLMKPLTCSHQEISAFTLDISPTPTKLYPFNHVSNGIAYHAFFDQLPIDTFEIKMKSTVHTMPDSFCNFIIYPFDNLTFPIKYPKSESILLQHCIKSNALTPELNDYNQSILNKSNNNILNYLNELNSTIYSDFKNVIRPTGPPKSAHDTLIDKSGACRDKAVLFLELARHMGIAGRFVSGYFLDEIHSINQKDLHAWVEIYLSGAGWVGYDPSCGLQVTPTHIPICSSAIPELCMPVFGSYKGSAKSLLKTSIEIQKL